MDTHTWIAEQRFGCVAADGQRFDLTVRLGQPHTVADTPEDGGRSHGRCRLALEPLARDCWSAGNNPFQALCLALNHVRTVFKMFLAEGGRIYWEDTDSHIDIDSSWFGPFPSPATVGLWSAANSATNRPML